ncbi:winged helix-turn-helix transcriptional regulator [soil metagenome]
MRSYGQYCPIARASEVLAERWTPIILRDLLNGRSTFSELAEGAPGLSRTLLTSRLRELERAGVIQRSPKGNGRAWRYEVTDMGRELRDVLFTMGKWGERWLELAPEHTDPGVVLHSWWTVYLDHEQLPHKRVVARFDFPDQPVKGNQHWFIFNKDDSEVCRTDPGFDTDLVVTAESKAFTEWHLGRLEWADAVRNARIKVAGPPALARALPTWNRRSGWAHLDHGTPETQRPGQHPERS